MNIPQLSEVEKLILQNLMLRIALEEKHIDSHEVKIMMAKININKYKKDLDEWNTTFNERLKKFDLDLSKVFIDADTGAVTLLNESLIKAVS